MSLHSYIPKDNIEKGHSNVNLKPFSYVIEILQS